MGDPILEDLDECFPDTITHESYLSSDGMGGTEVYATATTWKARIRDGHKLVRDRGGRLTMSTVQVTIKGVPGVKPHDLVTLPSRYDPQTPAIIGTSTASDENGVHHERVFF